ncbi:MAG: hypothetical protein GY913_15600 [Proteobacteria bacterium]|nr:hypothetical protein [Pseudomonadota bacterium]MCP4918334.1 hypothetical protein [Pseudomonadota bacterium]
MSGGKKQDKRSKDVGTQAASPQSTGPQQKQGQGQATTGSNAQAQEQLQAGQEPTSGVVDGSNSSAQTALDPNAKDELTSDKAPDEGADKGPPVWDEEHDEELDQVEDKADAKTEDGGEAKKEGEGEDADKEKGGEDEGDGDAKGEGGGGSGDAVAAAPGGPGGGGGGPAGAPVSFQSAKSSSLSKWDDEVAWSDYFKNGEASGMSLSIDRNALVMDALAGGAMAGFLSGAKAAAIDLVVNTALSRVPVVSGFLEMARIAYDPAGYLQSLSQSTIGKAVIGVEQIMSGDPISMIEGVLNIINGLNGVIGMLSNICWIAASLGFLAGLFCPAILPFVALAASWATTLGSIAGVVAIVTTLLQAGVVGLRALQIKYSDADPREMLAQGESLREQTSAFTAGFTVRAAGSLKGRGAKKMQERRNAKKNDAEPVVPAPTAKPETRMERVMQVASIATGNFGDSGYAGSGMKATIDGAKTNIGKQGDINSAYRGTGKYSKGGSTNSKGNRSTMQQIADMQGAGANVFANVRHRDRVTDKLKKQGEGDFTSRAEDVTKARADLASANERVNRARQRRKRIQDKQQETQARLSRAKEQLATAQDQSGTDIKARTDEVAQRQQLHKLVKQDEAALDATLTHQRDVRRTIEAHNDAHPSPQYKKMLEQADADVAATQASLSQARRDTAEAKKYYDDGVAELATARKPVDDAQTEFDSANRMNNLAGNLRNNAQTDVNIGRGQITKERQHLKTFDAVEDGRTKEGNDAWEKGHDEVGIWQAIQGQGPSGAYGVKRANARLLTGDVLKNNMEQQEETEAEGQDPSGGPLGAWEQTSGMMDGSEEFDAIGKAGRGDAGYQGQLDVILETLKTTLPAVPTEIPGKVDGATEAWKDLEEEELELQEQKAALTSVQADADIEQQALVGIDAVADANKGAAAKTQEGLDEKKGKQDELKTEATNAEGTFDKSGEKSDESQGLVGGIITKFMSLMNMIPSKLMGNSGEGSGGAKKLDEGVKGGGKATETGSETVAQVTEGQEAMVAATDEGKAQVSESDAALDTAKGEIAAKKDETGTAQDEMAGASTDLDTRLTNIATEQERLEAVHDMNVEQASSWSNVHETQRVAGMGELDGIVKLVEKDQAAAK